MKKIKAIQSILSVLVTISILSGCSDLDVDIKSQLTSFPPTDEATEAASADVYNAYRETFGKNHWYVQTVSSDEALSATIGNDYYDGGVYMDLHLHSWNPTHNMLTDMWNSAMKGVTSSNTVLAMLDDDESEGAAPIRAMRAYYYFILMDNFGGVPLITALVDKQPDRSSRKEICLFIESELLAVLDILPTNVDATTYGKPTRYMAEALLAKLYLNWTVYTTPDVASYTPDMANEKLNSVVAMCDAIIKTGKFNLNDKFLVKFRPDNGPHIKDFIFAMPYDREKQRGMIYARYWIHRSAQKQFGDLPQSVGGTMRCLPEFYDKFNLEGDERNASYLTGLQYRWENYEQTDEPFLIPTSKRGIDQDYDGEDADDEFEWQMEFYKEIELRDKNRLDCGNDQRGRSMGYRSVKFIMDPNVTSADERSQSNDVPIFRYADVLLMKAEAILRGATPTNGDTPASLMNEIRSYVNAPTVTGTPTLDDLLDERAREFADESWRRNDLIRYGKFEDNWGFKKELYPNGLTEKYRRIFPVPQDVLNVNTNWTQNDGY